MTDLPKFFAVVRASFGALRQSQVSGFEAVLAAADGAPLAHQAYMLATAWHETNFTMQPVREAYWLSEDWRRRNLRYYPHYGRGYVQLTWPENYEKADRELKLGGALVADLDIAMQPEIAAKVMRRGMDAGWFAADKNGKRYSLARMLPAKGGATEDEYAAARRIINGLDAARAIAKLAVTFEKALKAGGMK